MIARLKKWLQFVFTAYYITTTGVLMASLTVLTAVITFPFGFKRMHSCLSWLEHCWINAFVSWTNYVMPSEFIVTLDPERLSKASITDTMSHIAIAYGIGSGRVDPSNPKNSHHEIVISNHQIYSDWLYMFAFLNHLGRAGQVKVVLKRTIQFVPFFGLAMKIFGFVFMHRKWAMDKHKFDRRLRRIGSNGVPYQLLIFPEGTTLTEGARIKSQRYSKEHGHPVLQHTLLPRSTGLYFALKALLESGTENNTPVEGILDLTIGYSGLTPKHIPEVYYTLTGLFKDSFGPKKIHVNCSYVPISTIPLKTQEQFTEWLVERFRRKDELLEHFYIEGKFSGIESRPMPLITASSQNHYWSLLFAVHLILAMLIVALL